MHTFSEGFSIMLHTEGQELTDYYWESLTANGGKEGGCGWLKDKFGVSWQIIPKQLRECLGNPDPEKASRAMTAMMKMSKMIVSDLEDAVK